MSEPNNPSSSVILVADPDETPVSVYAEKGGTLQWINDSTTYPRFAIEFVGNSPAGKGDKLTGSNNDPVKVHVKERGEYKYNIRHMKDDGTAKTTGPFLFSVSTCKTCH